MHQTATASADTLNDYDYCQQNPNPKYTNIGLHSVCS